MVFQNRFVTKIYILHLIRSEKEMANKNSNNYVVPQAKAAMEQFKMEAANEVGVTLNKGYNGDLTSRQAGSIGGQMVNLMMPEQQWKFQRINRNAYGHCTHITLSMVAGL